MLNILASAAALSEYFSATAGYLSTLFSNPGYEEDSSIVRAIDESYFLAAFGACEERHAHECV
jgi:hypothetical protein